MIQSNELRFGNYVNHAHEGYLKICALKHRSITAFNSEQCFRHFHYSDIEAIHLTDEILKKAGFEWKRNYLSIDLKHARMRLAFCNGVCDKMTIFQFQGRPFDSAVEVPFNFGANHPSALHELQNLYHALAGEELNIQLTNDNFPDADSRIKNGEDGWG